MTEVVNTESAFRIIQSILSPRAEIFKRWLAKVAYERGRKIRVGKQKKPFPVRERGLKQKTRTRDRRSEVVEEQISFKTRNRTTKIRGW